MPLRAIIDGVDVIAPLLSEAEWEELKEAVRAGAKTVIMPCCRGHGHPRASKLGTKHFYHSPAPGCNWQPETVEHLKAKAEIAVACHDAGYDVATEFPGSDWCADVLATKGRTKIAFEVQWSRQTLAETLERQERYTRDGVRGCWFFKIPPKDYNLRRDLPLFPISFIPDGGFFISVGGRSAPLGSFITGLLARKVKFCHKIRMKKRQKVRIVFIPINCWKCKKASHIYYLDNGFVSNCGVEQELNYTGMADREIDENGLMEWHDTISLAMRPEVVAEVRRYLQTPAGKDLLVEQSSRDTAVPCARSICLSVVIGAMHFSVIFI